jgi:arylsulfatase A-like enzyme
MPLAGARRALLIGVACVAGTLLGCSRAPTRPNLVLVVIDTLRADHLGSYGYAKAQTPQLDALAARGTRFAAARSASSWTLPSVASILTGRYPVEHGAERLVSVLSDQQVTAAEMLAAAGYETVAFSANVSLVIPESGFGQGFERFDVLEAREGNGTAADPVAVRDGTNRAALAARADELTDAVLAWVTSRPQSTRPFFLYVHYFDPHASYSPPAAYAAKFGVQPNDPLLAPGQGAITFANKVPEARELATLQALYDAEIAFTDHELGRLFDRLGLADAVTIVTADHGEEFGDHGGMLHGKTLFEEMLHVPLIVAGGGLPAGRVVDAPVSLVSIFPTLGELAKATLPAGLPSRSLVATLRGGAPAPEMIFADLAPAGAAHRAAVIDDSWKLILNRGFVPLLFDLASDPGETKNRNQGEGARTMALQKGLGEHNKAGFRARAAAPPVQRALDADRRERLRQLGYVE